MAPTFFSRVSFGVVMMQAKLTESALVIVLNAYVDYSDESVDILVVPERGTVFPPGAKVEVQLFDERSRKVVRRKRVAGLIRTGKARVTFSTKGLIFSCHQITAEVWDGNGRSYPVRVEHRRELWQAGEWLGGSEGVSRKVLSPWAPVGTECRKGSTVLTCWGREYAFGKLPFPEAINALDADLLAGPINVKARVNGRAVTWTSGKATAEEEKRDHVCLHHTTQSDTLTLTANMRLEYDGMLRIDWQVEPKKAVTLDELSVEIPINKEYAQYVYHWQWGAQKNARVLPEEGLSMTFKPIVWLGNNERGLSWFCESDRNWHGPRHAEPIVVETTSKKAVLRQELVTGPIPLAPDGRKVKYPGSEMLSPVRGPLAKLDYTFGLQATPIKPIKESAWDHRIVVLDQRGDYYIRPRVVKDSYFDELASKGVRTVVMFEEWVQWENYVRISKKEKQDILRTVKAAHKRGISVLLYFGFLISDRIPEWAELGAQCVRMPKRGYPVYNYPPQPTQAAWITCYRSEYQDLLIDGIANAMDELDIDGVYLDGTATPLVCNNMLHGCGYTYNRDGIDNAGSVRETYPLFAVRELMRRLYTVVKSRKPNGQVDYHNSTCLVPPTLAWTTSSWDGEQFQGATEDFSALDLIPLDAFRCEFMGHPWGTAAEFLRAGKAYTHEQVTAVTLLHDVPTRPLALEPDGSPSIDLEIQSKIWATFDAFDKKNAEWFPYWRNDKVVAASGKGVLVSLYKHPRNGVLAVVSNLGSKQSKTSVRLDVKALQLTVQDTVLDVIAEKSVPDKGGELKLDLSPMAWQLIWFKPAR